MRSMKNVPKVSVIIASHRPDMVGALLNSLPAQKNARPGFEVIIVTDYPNGSLQQKHPGCLWLFLADTGISKKRNAGVTIARGTYLAFIDDDCIAASDWIEQGAAYLDSHPETTAVEGATSIASDLAFSSAATREYRRLEKPGFRTNNLFFRTTRFRAIGGFDERFTVQREDIDLAFTAFEQGYRIDYCRDLRVTHRFRPGEKWDLLKNCWNRRFDPLLCKKHPGRYLKTIGSPLPPSQAAILLAHVLLLFALGKKRAAAVVAGADALLVSLLGLRRSGLRPFSVERWARESLQLLVAPLVVIAALAYGWVVIGRKER
ncbi:MAG: glycosyltransferase family 2 protein [Chitinispirillaceae bacterium]|nr:glycosyltransferase family 2 protein [Chitinispirillaceae bacterium]